MILNEYKKGKINVRLVGKPIDEDFELFSENWVVRKKIKRATLEEKKEIFNLELERLHSEHDKELEIEEEKKIKKDSEILSELEEISINIWDEVNQNKETYIYVEEDLSNKTCKLILNEVLSVLKKSKYKDFVKDLSLYDSCEKYKCLLFFGKERSFVLFKRWEIRLHNITDYEVVDEITDFLKSQNIGFKNKKLDICSES